MRAIAASAARGCVGTQGAHGGACYARVLVARACRRFLRIFPLSTFSPYKGERL